MIEKDYSALGDKQLRRILGLDGARCAMAESEPFRAVNFLQWLNRDYPDDPDVLYLSTRIFSDLSTLASQHLLRVAPGSYQAHQIDAEVLEVEGRNADALAEYREILKIAPQAPGAHYHLGRLLLEGEHDAAAEEQAGKEFEAELALNPGDAASEYELGEMARAARKWDEAIEHFRRAAQLDPQFPDALIGLGKSLVSAGRAAEAVAPLERAVKLEPSNGVAHYQLSFAYLRVGRDADAKRELALYQEAHEQQHRVTQAIRQGLVGIPQPQTAEPPE
jgi:tetratricopeptide (TPR) repeat protein